MAIISRRAVWSSAVWMHVVIFGRQVPVQDGATLCSCYKSTYSSLPDDYNYKVELAMTSNEKAIVCYHPSVDIPYKHIKPIP
uniref:Large ribosomal subunit protein mL42 n=1 Tax=Sphenodon punctatus TaxID=8508 RepID=A0A8D0L2E3_SPHPU